MNKHKELNENELAAWLTKINTSIEPYSKPIAVAVFAIVAIGIAWGLYSSNMSDERSNATLQLLMKDPEVAEKYPDTPAASWALLYAGNDDLDAGIETLYQNRDDAETILSQARDSFNDAMKNSDDRLLRSRAQLGLAMVSESLGELDAAIDSYREVIKIGESDAMIAKANARIEELSSPDTKNFVAWFAKQDFAPADPSLPPALPSGNALPDMPDLKLPAMFGSDDDESDEDPMELEDKSGVSIPPPSNGQDESKPQDEEVKSTIEMPTEKKADPIVKEDETDTKKADEPEKKE